jgi:hypothetical protein
MTDDLVVLLRCDDVPAVRGEERVVWDQERLALRQVARTREAPPDAALRVDDHEPVVQVIGDQYIRGER